MNPAEIVLEHIDLYLGDTHALRDLNWRMQPGENWAMLGPNGAGKSALLKLLAGDHFPVPRSDAQYRVCGFDRLTPGTNVWDLKRCLGIVSPELQGRYDPATPGLNVVLSGFFSSNGLYESTTDEQNKAALSAMERIQAGHLAERSLGNMSYGEARRLLIARSLIHDPPLLVFDEPTNGLDMGTAESFLTSIGELAAQGHALLIVTHHLHEIIPALTHVAIMRNGRIDHAGEKNEIMHATMFEDLYGLSLDLHKRDGRYWALPATNPSEDA